MFENEGEPLESQTDPVEPAAEGDEPAAAPESLVDLDTVEKFKFGGREWARKDFEGAYMMQSDYTRKTQALAQERKYYDNLSADLKAVKADANLIDRFKQVYPEKFHAYLEYVQAKQEAAANAGQSRQGGLDPATEDRLRAVESRFQEQERRATDADIDANCTSMAKKFPDVPEQYGIAALQVILEQKRQDDPRAKLTPADWQKAWKSVDDDFGKITKSKYSKLVSQQTNASQKGKDVASGGGIPGQAPRAPRTIREATDQMLNDLKNA